MLYHPPTTLPIIDISHLHDPTLRPIMIEDVHAACKNVGLFQVINHGIPSALMEQALVSASEFFKLPREEKMLFMSGNVHKPVRYGMSLNHANGGVYYWRDFLKHYSHPLTKWIHLWPSNPPNYREKMGGYAKALQVLHNQLMQVLLETLGLNPTYLKKDIDEGPQVMAVNSYPECPEPELALGLPPHSGYGLITLLLQSCPGLEIMDCSGKWRSVPAIEGALIVQLGDQMQVLSNDQYHSLVHRATVSSERKQFSVASLHSIGLEKKVGPAQELVHEDHPIAYKEHSFKDFLDFLSVHDITTERFIDTLRKNS